MNDFDDEEARPDQDAPPPERAPAWLAVVRIVCVLGMAFGISFGIFLLLLPSWLGLVFLLLAVPFFVIMRYFEKYAATDAGSQQP